MDDMQRDNNASPAEAALLTRLEQLVPGARASGIAGTTPVDVVSVKWFGANFIEITYRHDHGQTGQAVLGREHTDTVLRLDRREQAEAVRAAPDVALSTLSGTVLIDAWQEVPDVLGR